MESTGTLHKAENALDAIETNEEEPNFGKGRKKGHRSATKRPKSYRATSKSGKGSSLSRGQTASHFKNERNSQVNDEYIYRPSPSKNTEYLSKVEMLIKSYSGKDGLTKSASALRLPSKKQFTIQNSRMTIDTKTNEVKRLKPKKFKLEKEKLYEEALEHKMQINILKDENTKLKTQLQQLQKENLSTGVLAEEMVTKQTAPAVGRFNKSQGGSGHNYLSIALKKNISELKNILRDREAEIENLKRSYKYTRITELETNMSVYVEELLRMRKLLDEVMKTKDPLSNPENVKKIEKEFSLQKNQLSNTKKEIEDLCEIIKAKDKALEEQTLVVKEKDAKIEKLKASVKDKNKLRNTQREKNKELSKVRNELILLKSTTGGKGKGDVDEMLKNQFEIQKDQISNKNMAITALKNEKRKLGSKVTSQTKQISELEENLKKTLDDLKNEQNQKKYFENLYKEEREKNVDLRGKMNTKTKQESHEMETKKNARPISANIRGRVISAKKLEKVKEEVEETHAEAPKEQKGPPKVENAPVTIKSIKQIVMAIRCCMQHMNTDDPKTLLKGISMTLKEFQTFL